MGAFVENRAKCQIKPPGKGGWWGDGGEGGRGGGGEVDFVFLTCQLSEGGFYMGLWAESALSMVSRIISMGSMG